MRFGLVQTAAPASEPVTTPQAKAHLVVETSADDSYIDSLVTAARQRVELETGRQLVQATWRLTLDQFPPGLQADGRDWGDRRDVPGRGVGVSLDRLAIELPRPDLIAVSSVTYVDTAGNVQTLDPALYKVDNAMLPGRVMPAWGQIWPVARYESGAVRVLYTAGYSGGVPGPLVQAILMLVGHWYRAREAVSALAMTKVPLNFEWLVEPYWCGEVR